MELPYSPYLRASPAIKRIQMMIVSYFSYCCLKLKYEGLLEKERQTRKHQLRSSPQQLFPSKKKRHFTVVTFMSLSSQLMSMRLAIDQIEVLTTQFLVLFRIF